VDSADAQAREAEARGRSATAALQQERLALEKTRGALVTAERELEQIEEQWKATRELAEEARAHLVAAGFLAIEAVDPQGLAERIAAELVQLEAGRRARADLERRRREAEQRLAGLEAQVAAASAQRDEARARVETLGGRRGEAEARLAEARAGLREKAAAHAWPGFDPLPAGRDEADVLESLRDAAQRLCAQGSAAVARQREAVAQLERAVVRAKELSEERARLEARAALHKTLADHLKANELVAWVQEEALRRLAEEGSRHLSGLSQQRYSLRLGSGEAAEAARADQDFFVVDRWNGDSVRSVRTLSGGETFLASLSLALALAESLASLSSGDRARDALESLFLDEGFGTLDADTLDTVVSALDALHGGQRMVGIVTHVRELAERLPARLEVRRQGSVSTASVV
jgi:exonuclease SbcC